MFQPSSLWNFVMAALENQSSLLVLPTPFTKHGFHQRCVRSPATCLTSPALLHLPPAPSPESTTLFT